jgi:hypothetical protein
MTKLSPTQRELLSLVAGALGGLIEAPHGGKAAIAALVKRGLLTSPPDAPSQIVITQAGRAAIAEVAEGAPKGVPGDALDVAAAAAAAATALPKGKLGVVISLLQRPEGAALTELMTATGWQAHSIRGAMSGALKKKLGLTVLSEKTEVGRTYRIPREAGRDHLEAQA